MKLFTILAKTDHLAASFKNMIADYSKFFSTKQNAFKGERKTYDPKPETVDMPNLRGFQDVVTTVSEKLNYFEENTKEYLQALFDSESTNASGVARAELIVDGESWGTYSSLELLRMKSLLSQAALKQMYAQLPTREETKNWTKTNQPEFEDRNIFEDTLQINLQQTTEKESYILVDPNLDKLGPGKYTPSVAEKTTKKELGIGTIQKFSGEVTHKYRAGVLNRIDKLLVAVIEALKNANDCEVVHSQFDVDRLFKYLHDK